MLATPTRAFVSGVFPGLTSLERRIVNIDFVRLRMCGAGKTDACLRPRCVHELDKLGSTCLTYVFFPAHHYFNTTAPMANSAPACARGSTGYPDSTLTTRSSHSYVDHGYTTDTLGFFDNGPKGYHLS
ncbi:Phenylalanine ammonia-lyase [Hordeum vulgare]|nr:Phenylalanine ammonia-lyase [Hordeum vulgare]